ncbi:type VII secretion protein EccE [Streptomyces sp. NPDC060194]|uniref:type VII secretion protein EccE n=1 Tax=Streptomyces sp. NPDC060194 TaxID=3347069 RepID=UPI003649EF21
MGPFAFRPAGGSPIGGATLAARGRVVTWRDTRSPLLRAQVGSWGGGQRSRHEQHGNGTTLDTLTRRRERTGARDRSAAHPGSREQSPVAVRPRPRTRGRRLGPVPLRHLVLLEAALAAAAALGGPWQALGWGAAAVCGTAGVARVRTVRGWAGAVARRARRRSAEEDGGQQGFSSDDLVSSGLTPHPYTARDGRPIGMVGDGPFLAAVVLVEADAPGLRTPPGTRGLPLDVLRDCLAVDDIALASAQVVTQTRPAPDPGLPRQSAARISYAPLAGRAGAPALRLTWVALRLDPALCPDAVRARGGGLGGAQRCLLRVADHAASRLAGAGVRATVLDPAGLRTALATAWADPSGDRAHTTYAVRRWPASGTDGPLRTVADAVAGVPAPATTLAVDLRPAPSGRGLLVMQARVRLTGASGAELAGAQAALEGVARAAGIGLTRDGGDRLRRLTTTLPLGGARTGSHTVPAHAVPALQLPLDDDGMVAGLTPAGHPLLLPLRRPAPYGVVLVGGLWTAQVLALRAVAAGVRVEVETGRAPAWAAFAEAVGGERVALRAVGRVPPSGATVDSPVLVVRDCGTRPPRGRVTAAPWQTVLTLLPYAGPAAPALLRDAALVGVQRVSPEEAEQLGPVLGLPPDVRDALPATADGVTLWCTGGERRWAATAATEVERGLLGAARRTD